MRRAKRAGGAATLRRPVLCAGWPGRGQRLAAVASSPEMTRGGERAPSCMILDVARARDAAASGNWRPARGSAVRRRRDEPGRRQAARRRLLARLAGRLGGRRATGGLLRRTGGRLRGGLLRCCHVHAPHDFGATPKELRLPRRRRGGCEVRIQTRTKSVFSVSGIPAPHGAVHRATAYRASRCATSHVSRAADWSNLTQVSSRRISTELVLLAESRMNSTNSQTLCAAAHSAERTAAAARLRARRALVRRNRP